MYIYIRHTKGDVMKNDDTIKQMKSNYDNLLKDIKFVDKKLDEMIEILKKHLSNKNEK